jgi:Putative peptidoglycan binding domain
MKRVITLLIGCSLALAGVAIAQQPEQQSTPAKKQHAAEKTKAAEAQPGAHAPKAHEPHAKANQPVTERGATNQPAGGGTPRAAQQRKGMKGRAAKTSAGSEENTGVTGAAAAGAAAAGAGAATAAIQHTEQAGTVARGKKKLEQQQVQQIKAQHANFRAQAKPQQVPGVTYNQNYRIQGSEHWTGGQYEVFRSYHPEWHDEGWYRAHYPRVELIGGGYYYFNNGYWFPAWGFSPSAQYYAYDGPIYVGHRAEPPDQVIADVQSALQQMGYYRGEVDGLVGPLTREALTAYQADNGLVQTAAIDEPTLDSLGMS